MILQSSRHVEIQGFWGNYFEMFYNIVRDVWDYGDLKWEVAATLYERISNSR